MTTNTEKEKSLFSNYLMLIFDIYYVKRILFHLFSRLASTKKLQNKVPGKKGEQKRQQAEQR